MTMTDPIADMLTRIRNANIAFHDDVADAFVEAEGSRREDPRARGLHHGLRGRRPARAVPGKRLTIRMKYSSDRRRTISGLKRVSRPGLRVYSKADGVPRVLGGMGIAILSTNQGLLTDREARERKVGGEVLCQVW